MIKAALDAYANATSRKFAHDRSKTVGASEVGQCARKTWYSKHEQDNPAGFSRDPEYDDSWGARMRGTVIEDAFWYPAMKAHFGDALWFAGPEQKTFVSGYLSATPDGMVSRERSGACFMLECKTADPRTNLSAPKPENVFQVQVQMGIMREAAGWSPTHSILSYINASFWNEVAEFKIDFDPAIYNTAKIRATEIMTAGSADEVKPEGFIAGGRECELCPFTRACGVVRRSVPTSNEVADPQLVAEIAELVTEVKLAEEIGDANAARIKEAQQEIRDRLRQHGVKKIPGLVSWSSIKGRKTYNNKKLYEAAIEAGIDIELFATVGEETDRLTITAPKDQNEDHRAA